MTALLPAPVEPAAATAREPWRDRLQPLVGRGGWPASLAVTLLAGVLRFVRLDIPFNGPTAGKIFDEIYYACDAKNLLRYGVEHATLGGNRAGECVATGTGSFVVHPPLGKWAIAVGIRLFGDTTFGWRFAAAVAGTVTVLVVVRAGRRMTGSTLLGCLAGLLLALDGLHFVQSRVAMLDVFLVLWVTAAFGCLLCDRQQVRTRLSRTPVVHGRGPRLGVRWWRVAAGVCLGAGCATKWSAVYYLALALVLVLAWEVGARRTAGVRGPARATVLRSGLPTVASLVALPLVVYLASWAGWFATDIGWDRHLSDHQHSRFSFVPAALRSLWHYHQAIYAFHEQLSLHHPYQSHPAGWLLLARPVSYYYPPGIGTRRYGCSAASCAREVLAIGNPAVWWAAIPMLVALVWLYVSRRDWRAGALVALVLTGILPWVRDDLKHRTMFLFYALPAVPFIALGLALVAGRVLGDADATPLRRRYGAVAVGSYVALVVAAFAYFYPILAAQTIPLHWWQRRMWFPSWI